MEGGSKSAAAARQEVVDLSKYLYLVDPGSCDINNILHMPHVVKFLNELQKSGVGPSGQNTKLHTLINGVKIDLVVRSKVMETKIQGICKSLRKECATIRLQKRDMFDGGSDLRVLRFLDDPRLFEVVTTYVAKEEMEDGENLMTRRYLMCSLMFKNAQREGPVVNLRVAEVERAVFHQTKNGETVCVYKVWLK